MPLNSDSFDKEITAAGLGLAFVARLNQLDESIIDSVHIHVTADHWDGVSIGVSSLDWSSEDDPRVLTAMTAIRKHLGGKWDKDTLYSQFRLTQPLVGDLTVTIGAPRKLICTPRVVGTKTEVQKVPTGYEEKEVTEDIIEWDCPKSLIG